MKMETRPQTIISLISCKALPASQNEQRQSVPKEPKILETRRLSGQQTEMSREEMQWTVLKLVLVFFCILQLK